MATLPHKGYGNIRAQKVWQHFGTTGAKPSARLRALNLQALAMTGRPHHPKTGNEISRIF